MAQGHAHGHSHPMDARAGDRRVGLAVAVNLLLTVAQVIGGLLSGSVALIADAVHNFSDAISLIIAFVARRIARRPADAGMTFGYGRAELVAALINYTTLIVIGLYLVYEGLHRLIDPPEVQGWIVVALAGVALTVDVITALLTYRLSKESLNIRAAFLHNLADALSSVAVMAGGTLILLLGWNFVDPVVTLLIAGYILWYALHEVGVVIRILMLGSPPTLDTNAVLARIEAEEGVASVHHLHLWQMDERENVLEAHLVLNEDAASPAQLRRRVKAMLRREFGITHATLELETLAECCTDTRRIGHDIAPDAQP